MKNKFFLTSLITSALLIISTAGYADDNNSVSLVKQQEAYQKQFLQISQDAQLKRAVEVKRDVQKTQKQIEENTKKARAKLDQQYADGDFSPDASQTPAPVTYCDCYANSEFNTSAKNFLYSDDGLRSKRISPACECKAPTDKELKQIQLKRHAESTQQTSSTPVQNNVTTTNNSDTNNAGFDIHY